MLCFSISPNATSGEQYCHYGASPATSVFIVLFALAHTVML